MKDRYKLLSEKYQGILEQTEEPVMKQDAYGNKAWRLNGKRHRVDGPAIEDADGSKYWYLNDKLHREDGPAIEGTKGYKRWYINDRQLTEEEFNEYNKLKQPVEVKDIKVLHDGKWYKLTAI